MALLEVKNLSISFGGLKAVDNFHVEIEKGQLYGLIGPNGAGKTTIFNLLTGVYKPNAGSIVLDDTNITGKSTIEINQAGIARTFQNIRLFKDMSVLDNVKAGLHNNHKYSTVEGIFSLPRYYKIENFDMTVLLIEHDMKLVSGICEKLTVLNFGQVLREGATSDVLHDPEVIKAYLGE